MTYAGFAAVLFRFVGIVLVFTVVLQVALKMMVMPHGPVFFQLLMSGSFLLVQGIVAILASKPLGRLLAAGLE